MMYGCDRAICKGQEAHDARLIRRRERIHFLLAMLLPVIALLSGAAAAAHRYGIF